MEKNNLWSWYATYPALQLFLSCVCVKNGNDKRAKEANEIRVGLDMLVALEPWLRKMHCFIGKACIIKKKIV